MLLGSESGRAMLAGVRTVIVDEIHARRREQARQPPGAVAGAAGRAVPDGALTRIGLSATQKPIEEVARFLVGDGTSVPSDRRTGKRRTAPSSTSATRASATSRSSCRRCRCEAVMSNEQWELVYARIAELVRAHRTTLVFVNTRRMAERAARHLAERLGKEHVAAHHGSLAKEQRLDAEQRLKRGELKVLVATASLELGIDIGDVDLVCQLGSPRCDRHLPAARRPLRPPGRRRAQGPAVPQPRATTWSNARRCWTACAAASSTRCSCRRAPLDVLAQQIVAEVAAREWDEDALFALVRGAWPYRVAAARRTSTRCCACWPRASPPAAASAPATCIATPCTAACAGARARA